MDLVTQRTYNDTYKVGFEEFTLPAGEYVQVRSGTAEPPVTRLEAQVPEGKTWKVRVSVDTTETSA